MAIVNDIFKKIQPQSNKAPAFKPAPRSVVARKPANTTNPPPAMPQYSGLPGERLPAMKIVDRAVLAANQMFRNNYAQRPERSHEGQLSRLVGQNIYTPYAELAMYGVPSRSNAPDVPAGGRAAFFDREGVIKYPPGYWDEKYDPVGAAYDVQHEMNHFFDRGGRYSNNQDFVNAAKQTDAEFFPGMGLKDSIPQGNGRNWGGPVEMYADVGLNPYWFRSLNKWYPQFTTNAYNMPAFAGSATDDMNGRRTWQFWPTPNRGPYTDIANRTPGKAITPPNQTPLYYNVLAR